MSNPRCRIPWVLIAVLILFLAACTTDPDDDDNDDNGVGTRILYVDTDVAVPGDGSSWVNAFDNLQSALAVATKAASRVGEIWVAEGSYSPSARTDSEDERSVTFGLVGGVAHYGGFAGDETERSQRDPAAHETILCGGGIAYHVVSAYLTSGGGTLDGFTITGGSADTSESHGGGVYIFVSTFVVPPTVRNCRFESNHAEEMGGGLYANRGTTVANCVFIGNSAHTGAGLMVSSVIGDHAVVANCIMIGNTGTGNLSAGAGSWISTDGQATVVNCLFSGNVADFGAGLNMVDDGSVINCTFSGNSTPLSLGVAGLRTSGSQATIANCIFWGNTNHEGAVEVAQLSGELSSELTVLNCNIEGLDTYNGSANLDSNPNFADADGADDTVGTEDDDLHLSGGSPCVGSGDASRLPADLADLDGDGDISEATPVNLDGDPRTGAVNRGAY